MIHILSDIAAVAKYTYDANVTEKNKPIAIGFLERQLQAHPSYDPLLPCTHRKTSFPYVNLMARKLCLFFYLLGQTPIIAGYKDHTEERRILQADDLYLLRPSELGVIGNPKLGKKERAKRRELRKTDHVLWSLYAFFSPMKVRVKEEDKLNWAEAIHELGMDEIVIQHFTRIINYDDILHCLSPYPLTFNHGGSRFHLGIGSNRKDLSIRNTS